MPASGSGATEIGREVALTLALLSLLYSYSIGGLAADAPLTSHGRTRKPRANVDWLASGCGATEVGCKMLTRGLLRFYSLALLLSWWTGR